MVVAITVPLVGAIVDNTRFRKSLGVGLLFGLAVISLIQTSINESNWFIMLLLQIPAIAMYMMHILTVSAYLPETSNEQAELNHAGSFSTMCESLKISSPRSSALISRLNSHFFHPLPVYAM